MSRTDQLAPDGVTEASCEYGLRPPREIASSDPEVLRAALLRESTERRRAECSATMQMEVVKLALDLLVREPDIEGFFGGLAKTVVEESESHTCAVWLLDETNSSCELWLAYVKDRLFTPPKGANPKCVDPATGQQAFPCETMAAYLFGYAPGWTDTVEYTSCDERLPVAIREFGDDMDWQATVATPLRVGDRMLGWMTVCSARPPEPHTNWGRVMLIEAIARQAALALHHSRVVDQNRVETRRKAILEERNRLARDIHDNLAQGFAAILMQLQGTQREAAMLSPAVANSVSTAVDLARTHLTEARRSVSALRPNVGNGEDLATALKRVADLNRRTTTVPIELQVDDMPRFGDGVEREIVAIAQEALTNAVRHARAAKITIRASTVDSIGLRLSVTDDGRGIPREPSAPGFGLTSMQERAERIGASLTIVTAPRNGTEVVLAWDPTMGTQVHASA
ncbi:MAG TPA: GAF domain-containing sensor histidine kinase [Vicinamibacterales bacterium]|nr:GAF domain-containing sensor histidine kinase [Vicinamibacterales bacterium]